ncbi:LysR family transcriptional regulator [Noviherbaspirillum sp. L7-7A]|uniref:LysR family transcriptional regulator n=1 Tax=Noviherbaspirillum sp. L7-7A TaxID=2850560 RepID=UPI0020122448|nr:LysR family transcriptional regulator [Noviherbaspirillum sp. L7-7A]
MDIENIDLNLLRIFDALIRARNVTLAGELVGLSQPAVSYALNKLRVITADPLFVRTPRGMEPTPRAARMALPVREILEMVKRDVFLHDEFVPGTNNKSFTISLSDVGETVFLPPLLKRLRIDAPNIAIKSVSMMPARLEEALRCGDVDLAVGYFPDINKANFYQQHLFSHPFACLVRIGHQIIKTKLTMKQFLDASHIVIRPEGRSQEIFERYLEEQGIKRRIGLSIPHFMSVPYLLAESDMIVTLPLAIAQMFAKHGELKILPLPIESPTFDLKQHWHARYHRDAANQWLRRVIYETFYKYQWQ